LYNAINIHTIKRLKNQQLEGSSNMSFAFLFQEGSSIMGRSSNIGGSSNVSRALSTFLLIFARMELRSVIAVIRHGDRTPKQKMKMAVLHPL
jgi:hypothetical protein